ncbi:MAG: hypothetical protein A2798_01300 [Candidatus Levybacteria bacterium RIFCSPHIGHO2_01_FULL_37_17]|nr:MAG: hypothetical protein A2798_01300 [Candidatus Levybacteria bacterium RIFCSPHIGHO2_01_FULL_37_17]OGH37087.1 MAG: hypothetical protein A2959_02160 [Candidatus Levybacteria bacterium RIFCSPLOWO2_01_FULL_38_23]
MESKNNSIKEDKFKFADRIIIESKDDSVVIKQLVPDDAQAYFDLVDSDRAHLSQFGDRTAEKYKTVEDVRESIVNPPNPNKIRFGIWDGKVMVGSDNLTPAENNSAELGSWVAKKYTGHRYAARARKLLIDLAFNRLGLDKVFSVIKPDNLASINSIESSGFVFEGTEEDGAIIYALYRLPSS